MATKIGTMEIEALRVPICSNWSFPPSNFQQDTNYTMSVDMMNNSSVAVTAYISAELRSSSGKVIPLSPSEVNISPGVTKKISVNLKISDSSTYCDTSWTLQNIGVKLKYGGIAYGPYCKQSNISITLIPNYKGSLGTGHTIPSTGYLGGTISFGIKAKNTNLCFKYNLWAKVICKLSTDETKQFSGIGSKVNTNPGSTVSLPVSVTVPTNIPIGIYNVYAELYAGP